MEVLRSAAELHAWSAGRPLALTVGFFDGLHRGHQHLLGALRLAAASALAPAVAVTFGNSPRLFHQPDLPRDAWQYLTTPAEKLWLLARTGIDAVLLLDYDETVATQTAYEFFAGLATQGLAALVAGYDTSVGCDMIRGQEGYALLAEQFGARLSFVDPYLDDSAPVKSSLIRRHVIAGELDSAAHLLGYRYFAAGSVVRGKGLATAQLGLPTANVLLDPTKLLPPLGVYAARAWLLDHRCFPAAVCLSTVWQHEHTVLDAPAAESAQGLPGHVLEAHLCAFTGDLYGLSLRVELDSRLRGWADYAAPEALAEAMRGDIAETLRRVKCPEVEL